MVPDLGLNSVGHRPRMMSPNVTSGASSGVTDAVKSSVLTADHGDATYHSRLPPGSSSLAGSTNAFCVEYVKVGLTARNGNATYTDSRSRTRFFSRSYRNS